MKTVMAPKITEFSIPGSIIRISFVDFITFHRMKIQPRSNLNLVVGPNGTGKSSILCGICLGLAGKPSYIGRANSVSEYIRRGCTKATIEIELYNTGRNVTIVREILPGNNSTWKLNGSASTLKKVEETVAAMNIQVDNLCQFLPQDRVADFVKMTPQELLENTEKLAGPPEMWSDHQKLKSSYQTAKDLEVDFARSKTILDSEEQKYARLSIQAEAYHAREVHTSKIRNLKKKKSWLQYVDANQIYQQHKASLVESEDKLKQYQAASNPLKKKVEEATKLFANAEAEQAKMLANFRQRATSVAAKNEAIEEEANKMAETRNEWQSKLQIEEERKKKLVQLKQHLQSLQSDFESGGEDAEAILAELQAVTAQLHAEVQDASKISQEYDKNNMEKSQTIRELQSANCEVQRYTDLKQQRLNTLRQKNRNAYDAYQWLSKNSHLFKKPIHGPIMTCINVRSPNWAKYLEAQVPFKDMIAFVCEDPDDLELFMANVRDNLKLSVNTVMMPNRPVSAFNPRVAMENLKQYDFRNFLIDMIEAPDAVMRYLCAQYHIHDVPVGTDRVKDRIQDILDRTPLSQFYTENSMYSVSISRYGNRERSTRCDEIRPRGILSADDSASILQQLQERVKELSQRLQELDAIAEDIKMRDTAQKQRIEKLREDKKVLVERRDAKKHLLLKIRQKQDSIKRCESEVLDVASLEKATKARLKSCAKIKMARLDEIKNLTEECVNINMACVAACMDMVSRYALKVKLEKEYKETTAGLASLKEVIATLKDKCQQEKVNAKALLNEAKKHGEIQEDEVTSLPDTVAAIDELMTDIEAQMDCLAQIDAGVLDAFKKQSSLVERLKKDAAISEQRLAGHHQSIDAARDRWLPPLERLVEKLNSNFSVFFKTMDCAGEVSLYKGLNERDYDKFGISIKVKYRDAEQLQELTAHQQSGGERSVATVLYLMAMQELVQVPFRCLDEINQGMDATNERRVFELITQTVCEKGSSQYFLVTPKLLPKLKYHDNIHVIIMHKGPHLISNEDMDYRKFIGIVNDLN